MKIFLKVLIVTSLLLNTLYAKKNEPRIALVIGNNNYLHVSKLKNATNDSRLIKKQLEKNNFLVFYGENFSKADTNKLINKFIKKINHGGVALIYYAGHGAQVNGNNYIIPIDAKLDDKNEFKYSSISINTIVSKLDDVKNRINILILDACRNNPFDSSSPKGLAPILSTQDIFISYAAQPNQVASDGNDGDKNSPFTSSLVKYMSKENLVLEEVFKKTRKDVYELTEGRQRPVEYSQIFGDFHFTKTSASRSLKHKANSKPSFKKHKRYIEPIMIKISKGSFIMGDNDGENSSPSHTRNIKKDFYMAKYEITFREYDLFCKDTKREKPKDNGFGRDNQPVINVNWHEAKAYADWLSKKTKKQYHLPSEAQWEYALRANSKTKYYFSDTENLLGKYCWYVENTKSHPYIIGQKTPNTFGLHDMLGNVREWVEDSFWPYTRFEKDSLAHERISFQKVIRGGNWYSEYYELFSYSRDKLESTTQDDSTGFRLVHE